MPDRDFDGTGFFKFMNEVCDALRSYRLSSNEWSIVMHIMRKTWGDRGKAWAPIRWTDFVEKCELKKATASRSLKRLIDERNFILREKRKGEYHYKINSKPSTWKDPNPYKEGPKTGTKKRVPEMEPKEFQKRNKKDPELELFGNPTFNRKDNIKDKENTPPIIPPNENGDKAKKKKVAIIEAQAKEVIDFLNFLSGKTFKHSEASLEFVRARLNEGYTLEQLKYVCQIKWDDPDHKEKYYRPSTLFRPRNFESYINEKGSKKKLSKQMARMKDTVELFARRHHERQNPTGGR